MVDGDLNTINADAVLVPTDARFAVRDVWWPTTGPDVMEVVEPPVGRWSVFADPRVGPEGGPAVWYANIGDISGDPRDYVRVAEEFVGGAATTRSDGVVPRLALNVIGAGFGGMAADKGMLIQHLIDALTPLAVELGVDVVLVAWGAKQYAAARRAQERYRRIHGAPAQPGLDRPGVAQAVDDLAAHARSRRLVLFVGAGVSAGAGLPVWQDMLLEIAGQCDPPLDEARLVSLDYRDQAQILSATLGRDEYRRALCQRLTAERHSLAHALLASIDPHEVVTTNYDDLMERAFGQRRRPAVLPREPVGVEGRWILKLHGSIEDADSVVLTRDDYLGLPERAAALLGIVQAMLITKHMLFVGYSLSDDSFHQVVHEVRRALPAPEPDQRPARIGSVLTLFDDPLLERLWGDELRIVSVAERPLTRTPAAVAAASRQLDVVLDEVAVRSADVSAFLLDGTYARLLDPHEEELRAALERSLAAAEDAGVVGDQVLAMLRSLTVGDHPDV